MTQLEAALILKLVDSVVPELLGVVAEHLIGRAARGTVFETPLKQLGLVKEDIKDVLEKILRDTFHCLFVNYPQYRSLDFAEKFIKPYFSYHIVDSFLLSGQTPSTANFLSKLNLAVEQDYELKYWIRTTNTTIESLVNDFDECLRTSLALEQTPDGILTRLEIATTKAEILQALKAQQEAIRQSKHEKAIPACVNFYEHKSLPDPYVARPVLLTELRNHLLSTDTRPVVLHAMGGSGKSVIARAICDDPILQQTFHNGILFCELAESADIVKTLAQWVELLGGQINPSIMTGDSLKLQLKVLLQNRKQLIVIDNVWTKRQADLFNVGGKDCRILFTTRHAHLVNGLGFSVTVVPDEFMVMQPDESLELLRKLTGNQLDQTSIEIKQAIVTRLGHLPLAIELAAGQLRYSPRLTAETWFRTYTTAKLRKPLVDQHSIHDDIRLTFELSLDYLSAEQRRLYRVLAVLHPEENIPTHVIERLWKELDYADSPEILLYALKDLALLKITNGLGSVRLHRVLHDLMKEELESNEALLVHRALVHSYRMMQMGKGWHTVTDDGYFTSHLVYHLSSARLYSDLRSLYSNDAWMNKRIAETLKGYEGYISDLQGIWEDFATTTALQQISENAEVTGFADCFRFALISSSLTREYSPIIMAGFLKNQIWSVERTLLRVTNLHDPLLRAKTCAVILEWGLLTGEHKIACQDVFFQALEHISNEFEIWTLVAQVAEMIDEVYIKRAVELTESIKSLFSRPKAALSLLPRLSPIEKSEMVQRLVEDIEKTNDFEEKASALSIIASELQDLPNHVRERIAELIFTVYETAIKTNEGKETSKVVAKLASLVSDAQLSDAITVVERTEDIHARCHALVSLANRSDTTTKTKLLDRVIADILANDNSFTRSIFPLIGLYNDVPHNYRIRMIEIAFDTGERLRSHWHRAEAFRWVVYRILKMPNQAGLENMLETSFESLIQIGACVQLSQLLEHLPEPLRQTAVDTIVTYIHSPIKEPTRPYGDDDRIDWQRDLTTRISCVGQTLKYANSGEVRNEILKLTIDWSFSLVDPNYVFAALDQLIPNLTRDEILLIVENSYRLEDSTSRAAALLRIAKNLPYTKQQAIVDRVLNNYLPQLPKDHRRAQVIASAAPILNDEQIKHCLAEIGSFMDENAIADGLYVLSKVADNVPVEDVFRIMMQLSDEKAKAHVLKAISAKLTLLQLDESVEAIFALRNLRDKAEILAGIGNIADSERIDRYFERLQSETESLNKVILSASLLRFLPETRRQAFLESAVEVIRSSTSTRNQFAIAWATAAIAPYLAESERQQLLEYALGVVATMSGNTSTYPGGNPKTNAYRELIPFVDAETRIILLDEVERIPSFRGFSQHPIIELTSNMSEYFCSDEELKNLLVKLKAVEDSWERTNILEDIASTLTSGLLSEFMELGERVQDAWMRARIMAARYAVVTDDISLVERVQRALVEQMWASRGSSRDELLWSVDVHLYKPPYLSVQVLSDIADTIIEMTEQWNWLAASQDIIQ